MEGEKNPTKDELNVKRNREKGTNKSDLISGLTP